MRERQQIDTSAIGHSSPAVPAVDWRAVGKRYFNLSLYYRHTFGGETWKISVDGGFHCPNADGTISRFGCTFCNIASFSPSRRYDQPTSIAEQIRNSIENFKKRRALDRFIAYFQPGTNTYAPLPVLKAMFSEAVTVPGVVGLAIGTRPDCLPPDVLDFLAELSEKTWVSVEIGLQSAHDATLRRINRGHTFEDFCQAVWACAARNLRVCAHVMFGLPGETAEMMLGTICALRDLPIHAVKIHNLYVARDTALARIYEAGMYRPLEQDEYAELVVAALERISPAIVIERLTAETSDAYLIAPEWCRDKSGTLQRIQRLLEERDTYQGKLWDRMPEYAPIATRESEMGRNV
jgi:radical SAM protein (TIGR01212 family)